MAPGSRPFGEEIAELMQRRYPGSTCTHLETIPGRPAQSDQWPEWAAAPVLRWLAERGVEKPYRHQRRAADLAHAGRHVVIATGTSSGKSLAYQLPIATALAEDPAACALYLTPTKALGSDQLAAAERLVNGANLANIHPAPYDGDTPVEARRAIRETTRWVFTNPDMVHAAILPNHVRWARLFRHLKYVVIDECHSYRGVFGANVALVLRRLRRLAAHYHAAPTFVCCSATSANPAEHAANLLGVPATEITAITEDASPTGSKTVMLWEPGFIDGATGEHDAPVRRSANSEAAGMMAAAVAEGSRTLTFVRTRRGAEVVALGAAEELALMGRPDLGGRVASYRAGYLAEDRRALERALDSGALVGMAATNALELGIDVGGLDVVVSSGYPGTVASFWQQAGRAGRRGQGSLMVLVARDEPMDTYLVHHPEAVLGRPIEAIVFDPRNPHVLAGHVYCAAVERALTDAEVAALGAEAVAASLEREGLLRHRPRGWFAVDPPNPAAGQLTPENAHARVSLRGSSGEEVTIVDSSDGRVLGTIDAARAPVQIHPGAVYLHRGTTYVIDELDLEEHVALARLDNPEYTTFAQSDTSIRIIGEPDEDELANPSPGLWVANVDVEVTTRVTGYLVRGSDGTVLETVPLMMPPQVLETRAVAYTLDPALVTAMGISEAELPGALHAAEHAAIGLLPLLATCDRWDIGGVSTAQHQDTGLATVFVYDGYPGGAGFADCGYRRFSEWIAATFEAVRSCGCESGCPSCVQSPKCGNGNEPLDKAAALRLLGSMVSSLGEVAPTR